MRHIRAAYPRGIAWLEDRVFPVILTYAKHPITIVAECLLFFLLVGFSNAVIFVLLVNSYLNSFSNVAGSIILHNQDKHHRVVGETLERQHAENQRRHDEHAARLARLEAAVTPPARVEDLSAIVPALTLEPAPALASATVEDPPKPKRSHHKKAVPTTNDAKGT